MAAVSDLYKKSILFEIVNRKSNSTPVEAFTLTIPPENIEIEEPQRVHYTKTFGGIFIDDYGPDNLRIVISGNTGGTDVRRTYAKNTSESFNGKSAFFYFRDTIMRYKSNKAIAKNYDDYDLIIYDLSSYAPDNAIEQSFRAMSSPMRYTVLTEGYVVSLQKFKMTRSKEKPLFYNYTIELVGIRSLGTYSGRACTPVKNPDPQTLIGSIRKGLRTVQSFFTRVRNVYDKIESAYKLIDDLEAQINSYFHQTVDIIVYPAKLAKMFLGKVREIIEMIDSIGETAEGTWGFIKEEYLEVVEIAKEVGSAAAALVVFSKTPESGGNITISSSSVPSKMDAINSRFAALTVSQAEQFDSIISRSVEEKNAVIVYGHTLIKADGSTTLESLATEYYGDPSLAELIAVYNNFESDDDIIPGSSIKIPVILQGGAPSNNFVYSEDFIDVYGADIRLDSEGNPVVSVNGDYAIIEGPENLIQAINLRLNQELGTRLRLAVYGIRNTVGSAMTNSAPIAYILANIKDTIMQDPRVSKVSNIKIKGLGDKLYMSMDIHSIKLNEVIPFTGVM